MTSHFLTLCVRFASLATIILQNSFRLLINSKILKFVIIKLLRYL